MTRSRVELIEYGRTVISEALRELGGRVAPSPDPRDSRLMVRGPAMTAEVFVSTQRLGGYALWTKRRLEPSSQRFVAVVVVDGDAEVVRLFLPTTEFHDAAPPLASRDFPGRKSEPEYGIVLTAAALPQLEKYSWSDDRVRRLLKL